MVDMWVRIDNRLVHGQVIETWIPYIKAKFILVVNDSLANDILQQEIIKLAVPSNIEIKFVSLAQVQMGLKGQKKETLVLFANCQDARVAFEQGFKFEVLNVGNLHYSPGKEQFCDHIALSKEDIFCLKYLLKKGVNLDFRCVPHKPVQIEL
ncbi:MAG: PTS system sorbose subfamily IIB component [Desulfonauticus sp. 38_4375]|nr:MAG: PTS system sorbose subfamily IIB component [Desulfonauticus sp. 38_4375]